MWYSSARPPFYPTVPGRPVLDLLEDLRRVLLNFLGIGYVVGIGANHLGGVLAGFTLIQFRQDFRNWAE